MKLIIRFHTGLGLDPIYQVFNNKNGLYGYGKFSAEAALRTMDSGSRSKGYAPMVGASEYSDNLHKELDEANN
jgi:hypothetical protein